MRINKKTKIIIGSFIAIVLIVVFFFNLYTEVYLKYNFINKLSSIWVEIFDKTDNETIDNVSTCIYEKFRKKYGSITNFPVSDNYTEDDLEIVLNCFKKESLISESKYTNMKSYDSIWKNYMFKNLLKDFNDMDSSQIEIYVNCVYSKLKGKYGLIHLAPVPKDYSAEDWEMINKCAKKSIRNKRNSLPSSNR